MSEDPERTYCFARRSKILLFYASHITFYSSMLLSTSLKFAKKVRNSASPWVRSFTPIVSRMECIDNCGHPKSIACDERISL